MFNQMSSANYLQLLEAFPPRPITSEPELLATQKVIDSFLDKEELTQNQRDYINVLGALVREYEQSQEAIPDICGAELLKALLVGSDLRQKDLVPIFKSESVVSAILSGQRQLRTNHIQKLSEFFNVSPAAFFPSNHTRI